MQPKQEKGIPNVVVEVASSDDEDGIRVEKVKTPSSNKPPLQNRPKVHSSATTPSPQGPSNLTLEARSFWKAGAYDIGPTKWTPTEGQLEHARVHPKFLHSNATSHKWAFGAIAELLDNAVDEISNGATFVKVDRIYNKRDNSPALVFLDDGGGMDPECVRKCMSLGYSTKKANTTIGQYGNGFKTSTMRLGADAIVFSRTSRKGQATQSVGLLSYTFLRRTGQDDVIVPMVDFDVSNHWAEPIIYSSQEEWSGNLSIIMEWSPFASKDELMQQFEDIGSHGTKIIIYNLWLNDEGIFELNFDDDEEDIRLRDEASLGGVTKTKKVLELQSHISYRMRFSLRAYASMLYLRRFTNFNIILRGTPVEQFNIADELKYPKSITYRPHLATTSKEVAAETTLGFIKEAPYLGISGFNIYHKNRLIRPFWKVTGDGSSKGNGVVGVLEANFIEPAHDKQDFERSSMFFRLEIKLKQMIMDYWKGHCHLIGHQPVDPNLRNLAKAAAQPPVELAANVRKQVPVAGLSVNAQKETRLNQPIMGRTANIRQDLARAQPVSVQEVACVDNSRSTSVDQICEENIQLFMRCEEHKQKENELKRTIAELEEKVEETKKKCAHLSLRLQSQRKQKLI